MITVAVAALRVVLPGVAWAEPPSNDDFGTPTVVSALPFAVAQDTSGATKASDDPSACDFFNLGGTVWFDFTPGEDLLLRASTAGSDHGTILSAYTGARNELVRVPDGCDISASPNSGATITFRATAGTTYHFLVAGFQVPGGALSFGLQVVPPAPNDDFANAELVSALPSTRTADLPAASIESDEPTHCAGSATHSAWYAFTSTATTSVVARLGQFANTVSVYTGNSLPDLREIQCAPGQFGFALFRANAGVTYYIRVAGPSPGRPDTLSLTEAPALRPHFFTSPQDPSIFEMTSFSLDGFIDPLDQPITGGEWEFGDGTTAPVTSTPTQHHYTADGTYAVTLTVVSQDGRTGTLTRPITVVTHDVAIGKFSVPGKARTGDTKPIAVHVANTRYRESSVTTELYKNSGQGWTLVGTLTLDVPARADRTVKFPFAYTFTAEDAVAGEVTFRAVVRLASPERDARPQDNELIAAPTTVQPSLMDLRFA